MIWNRNGDKTLRAEFGRAYEQGRKDRIASRERADEARVAAEAEKIREIRELYWNSINNDLKRAAKNLKADALADAKEGREQKGFNFTRPESKKLGIKGKYDLFDPFLFGSDSPYHISVEDLRKMPGYAALDRACKKADVNMKIQQSSRNLHIIIQYKMPYKTPMHELNTRGEHFYVEAAPIKAQGKKATRVPPARV